MLILVLAFLSGATLVTLFSFEQYSLRPLAEMAVTRITGRTFRIEGNLDARAGRIVTVRADGFRLANAEWGSREDMLIVEGFELAVDLLPLLGGVLSIDDVVIKSGKLLSEQDAQGRSNWAMFDGEHQTPDEDTGKAEDGSAFALLLAHAELLDIDITIKNPGLSRSLEIRLESFVQDAKRGDELSLVVAANVDNHPVSLQARIGPLRQLLAGGEIQFDFKGDLDVLSINADGRLDSWLAPTQSSLHITLESADVTRVTSMFALPEVGRGALALDIDMEPDGAHHRLDVAGSIGDLKLNANAHLQSLVSIGDTAIELIAEGPDLASIARLAGLDGLPATPFKVASNVTLSGTLLQIGETKVDFGTNHLVIKGAMNQFPTLLGTNLNLRLYGDNYLEFRELLGLAGNTGLKPQPFELHSDLVYNLRDQQEISAELTLGGTSAVLDGVFTENPQFVGSQLKYRIQSENTGDILRLLSRPSLMTDAFSLEGEVKRTSTGFNIDSTRLTLGENQLDIDGVIGDDPLRRDSNISLRYRGPDLDKIAGIAGYGGFVPAGVAAISAEAKAMPEGIRLNNLDMQLGRNRLKASGLIGMQPDLTGSRVNINVSGEDIAELLPPELIDYVPVQQSFEFSSTAASNRERITIERLDARLGEVRLLASGTVAMEPLKSGDTLIQVDVRGPNLAGIIPPQLSSYPLPEAEFSVVGGIGLDRQGLALDTVKVGIGANRLQLSGVVPLEPGADGLEVTVSATGPNLAELLPQDPERFDIGVLAFEMGGNVRLASGILTVRDLGFATARGRITGEFGIALDNPRSFGEFDLEASGDDLKAFMPIIPTYRPAAVAFDLDARGSWSDAKVRIDRGSLKLADSRIEAQGEFDLSNDSASTRLKLSASGRNLADLGQIQGVVLPPDPFQIEASVHGNTQGFEIPELIAIVGESDLQGSLQIGFADKPDIALALQSKLLDLTRFLPAEDSSAEVAAAPSGASTDGRVIPQITVPADRLNSLDMKTKIHVAELRWSNQILRDVDIEWSLQEGEFLARRIRATAPKGELVASFRISANGDRIATSGTLAAIDIVLGDGTPAVTGYSFPKQDFRLEFATEGSTVRELAANLNGYAQVTGKEGHMKNSIALNLLGNFFEELISAVNPFMKQEPYTTISCFAAYAEIVDGIATLNPGAVMQTDKLDMFAVGQVDLRSERIRLRFDTKARKGIGVNVSDFVNPFVGVGGTLARPKLGLDPKNAMFEGGVAYATGGLSIVLKGVYDRWFGAKNPCADFDKQAQEYLKANNLGMHREPATAD